MDSEIRNERLQRINEAARRMNTPGRRKILLHLADWLRRCDGSVIAEVSCLLQNASMGYRGSVEDAINKELDRECQPK